ncbi:MAG: hypothetical protein US89_C0005G0019 [Candidatus Peregrinibacteria bacterium GW2011_GWF2_38_29]|nr:MAG: hypothetical protein US89_C0005G0019 [Candidatus Peregrinibacteria bacterium GW2011_GWF2_38_29]HBB02608.1 hypothetical protein [Candidatus Peregrinibacteria bacterium]
MATRAELEMGEPRAEIDLQAAQRIFRTDGTVFAEPGDGLKMSILLSAMEAAAFEKGLLSARALVTRSGAFQVAKAGAQIDGQTQVKPEKIRVTMAQVRLVEPEIVRDYKVAPLKDLTKPGTPRIKK